MEAVNTFSGCSGVQIKTRKRNIAVALDPGSFANAVVVCFEDARESNDLEKNLQSAVKVSSALLCQFTNTSIFVCNIVFRSRMAGSLSVEPLAIGLGRS